MIRTINRNEPNIFELLLQNGAATDIIGRHGPAVQLAIAREDKKAFEMLLKYGASLKIKNDYEMTPLEVALKKADHKHEFLKIISYHQHC